MARVNPQTGQLEDDNGNPIASAPLDQVAMLNPPAQVSAFPQPPVVIDRTDPNAPPPETMGLGSPPTDAAPAPPPPAAPGEMSRKTSSTTRTREIAAPGEDAAMGKVQGEFTKDATLARREGENIAKTADITAKGAKATAAAASDTEGQLGKTITSQGQLVDQAQQQVQTDRQKYDEERAKLSQMKVEDYYEGKTGLLVGNAVAAALGAVGAALTHSGHNTALEMIQGAEHDYYARERLKIETQKDIVGNAKDAVGLSQQGVSNARLSKADALSDLNLTSAARMDALAADIRAKAAENGTDHAKIEGERLANAAEQKRDQYLLNYKQSLRTKLSTETQKVAGTGGADANSPAGRAAAAAQMQKATLAEQGMAAMKHAEELHKRGVFLTEADRELLQKNDTGMRAMEHASPGAAWLGRATFYPKSRYEGLDEKKAALAKDYDLIAQKTAGLEAAVHTEGEMAHARSIYDLTAPGASEVARAQTWNQIRGSLGANLALGGKYTQQAVSGGAAGEAAGAGKPGPGGPATSGRRGTVNGKPAIIHPDGSYDPL